MSHAIAAGSTGTPSDIDSQAQRFSDFLRDRYPRVTAALARRVLGELAPDPTEDIKLLARRLTKRLAADQIQIKHTPAIEAVSTMRSAHSWLTQGRTAPHTLKVLALHKDVPEQTALDWREAGELLVTACDLWTKSDPSANWLRIGYTHDALLITAPLSEPAMGFKTFPIVAIQPVDADTEGNWLIGAERAIEYLRRQMEESGRAIVNGAAVVRICGFNRRHRDVSVGTLDVSQVPHATLKVRREDDPSSPGDGYEIAAGEEVTCWGELDGLLPELGGSIEMDEEGGWVCGRARFVWCVQLIKGTSMAPEIRQVRCSPEDSRQLLHRYTLAQRIYKGRMPTMERPRPIDFGTTVTGDYPVDRRRIERELGKLGLTWEQFAEEMGEPGIELTDTLPLVAVYSLGLKLDLPDMNVILARPSQAQLVKDTDGSYVQELLAHVDRIRYRLDKPLTDSETADIRDAIEDLSASLLLRKGAFPSENPLPALVYSGDGAELCGRLERLGLVMYAGIRPHIEKIRAEGNAIPPAKYAIGHCLYLAIDRS